MWPADLNYVAALAAAAAYFVIGAVWYGVFAKPWMACVGKTEEEVKAGAGASAYVIAAASSVLAGVVLAALLKLTGATTVGEHICLAGTCGVGLVCAAAAKHYAFQGFKPGLLLIDGGYDVVSFIVMAVIIWAIG